MSYKYPKSMKSVFKNINLDIKKFDIIGITGPSGAGKSTFINCLIGLLKPHSGEINIDQIVYLTILEHGKINRICATTSIFNR